MFNEKENQGTEKKKVAKKEKPQIPDGLMFKYREINIPLFFIQTRDRLDKFYKGKLLKTCLNEAWKLVEKELKKYK